MFAVSVVVGGPVLTGAIEASIPRAWWIGLFAAARRRRHRRAPDGTVALDAGVRPARAAVGAAGPGGLRGRRPGLLPILLVVVAAVGAFRSCPAAGRPRRGRAQHRGSTVVARTGNRRARDVLRSRRPRLLRADPGGDAVQRAGHRTGAAAAAGAGRGARRAAGGRACCWPESARTAERLRISRELHDLIGHQLTVLTLELEAARHRDGERPPGSMSNGPIGWRATCWRDVRATSASCGRARGPLGAALRADRA